MKLQKFAGFLVASILGLSAGVFLLAGCSGDKVETGAEDSAAAVEATMVFYAMPG